MQSRKLAPEEIETMLTEKFGDKLKPVNKNSKRPSILDLSADGSAESKAKRAAKRKPKKETGK